MNAEEPKPARTDDRKEQSLSLLAEELEPIPPAAAQRARLLAELRGPERFTPWAAEVAQVFGLALGDARDALRRVQDPSAWQPGPWRGSQLLVTPSLIERRAVIARLPAGTCLPRHRHEGRELTYILDGELSEDSGLCHGTGVLLDMPPASEHEVTVSARGACLVVFSVLFE